MGELDTGSSDALAVLQLLGRTMTVRFGDSEHVGVLDRAGAGGAVDAIVRTTQNVHWHLTMLAVPDLKAGESVVSVDETGLSYRVLVAPKPNTPLVTYELGIGFEPDE